MGLFVAAAPRRRPRRRTPRFPAARRGRHVAYQKSRPLAEERRERDEAGAAR